MKAVFVCVENSNRSQMAEAFARLAGIEAYSAGSRPSGKVNPKAIESMREVGYDLSSHPSKGLADLPDEWDAAINAQVCAQSGARIGRFQTRKSYRLTSFGKYVTPSRSKYRRWLLSVKLPHLRRANQFS